jgi:HPt (histidine-containing phosphotransfer) domain-containing protein
MSTPQEPDLKSALDRMWLQFRPQMEERLSTLDEAATAFAADTLSLDHRSAAASAAHNLAGVLGTFGLARGTDLARELEQHYTAALNTSLPADESSSKTPTNIVAALTAELRSLIDNRESSQSEILMTDELPSEA